MKRTQQQKRDKRQKKLERTMVMVSLAPDLSRKPVSAMQALNTATKFRDAKNYAAARFICLQLLGHEYAAVDASIIMLEMSVELKRPVDTYEFCERLLQSAPKQLHAAVAVAQALRTINNHDKALQVIKKALKAHPTSCALRHMLAGYLVEVNEKDLAIAELRTIIQIDREFMPAYQRLAALSALTDEEIAWLERLELMGKDRITVYSALATAFQKQRDVDKEFHYLNLAHDELAKKCTYRPADFSDEVQATIDVFDVEFFRKHRQPVENHYQPIFIVGMPRSGSTLTEQILETNSGVVAIGESTLLHCTVLDYCGKKFGGAPFLESVLHFETEDFVRIADEYARQVARIYTEAPVFIDKQLNSYMYLGIICLAFPHARFIHTLRHPLDNCLSCYQQIFEQMDSSHSLESLAMMYRDHLNLMRHWKQHLGDRIFTASYEDMISDPVRQSRDLLAFCNIPWNEDVLNFHANKTAVKTASMMQVRQPIYSSSVEKWRKYETHLEPAMSILDLLPDGSPRTDA